MPIEQVYIFALIAAVIGFIIGAVAHWAITKPNRATTEEDGIIVLDFTDTENPYMSLMVSNEDLLDIYNKKRTVVFEVERVGVKSSHK